jgi:RecA/RadA recombinase
MDWLDDETVPVEAIDDAPMPEEPEPTLVRRLRVLDKPLPPKGPAPLPDMAALCRALPGRYKRVPTYCTPLDLATGGGMQTGRLMVIGGPPGVTKTGWALSMAYAMARNGVQTPDGHRPIVACFVASDERRDGLLSRLGQMEGLRRADLESEDLAVSGPAWTRIGDVLSDVPTLLIFDPRKDEQRTVEDCAEAAQIRARSLSARLVVIVDSIQTAPCRTDEVHEDERPRLEARMKVLQAIADGADTCVIAISELSRVAYREGAKAGLDAFKGAGGIEYTCDVAVLLKRIPEESDESGAVIEADIPKSRLGDPATFKMRRTVRCTFEPVGDTSAPFTGDASAALDESRIERLFVAVELAIVKSQKPVTSRGMLCDLVKGRRQDVQRAVSRLVAMGRIEGGDGVAFRVVNGGDS